ncbi:MAG: GNAT family N-acetyltransferase [Oscillospiraceae bacterium]|nr:GNAT family N-acetyltransferase [Oscillospiraceae bacterium]
MNVYEAAWTEALERELIRLSADWEAEGSCRGYRTNTREDLAGRRLFLAEDGGKLVGYCFGLRETAEKDSTVMKAGTPYFELEELYVVPARRSQGIGRKLFESAEQTAREEGLAFVMVSTATKNARAILHFYLDELGMSFWSARLFKEL